MKLEDVWEGGTLGSFVSARIAQLDKNPYDKPSRSLCEINQKSDVSAYAGT